MKYVLIIIVLLFTTCGALHAQEVFECSWPKFSASIPVNFQPVVPNNTGALALYSTTEIGEIRTVLIFEASPVMVPANHEPLHKFNVSGVNITEKFLMNWSGTTINCAVIVDNGQSYEGRTAMAWVPLEDTGLLVKVHGPATKVSSLKSDLERIVGGLVGPKHTAVQASRMNNPAYAAGSLLGAIFAITIMLLALVINIVTIVKWPRGASVSRLVIGLLLFFFPLLPTLVAILMNLVHVKELSLIVISMLVAFLGWIIIVVYARRTINRFKLDEHSSYGQAARYEAPFGGKHTPLQPYSGGHLPAMASPQNGVLSNAMIVNDGAVEANLGPTETPVIVRCKFCMGKWKSTAGEAKDLVACPKCNAEPDFRIEAAG